MYKSLVDCPLLTDQEGQLINQDKTVRILSDAF